MPYDRYHKDHQAENWWATVSGAGTTASGLDEASWADDYTRHRTAFNEPNSTTWSGVTDMTKHSGENQPTDLRQGRTKTGLELDAAKL